MDPNTKITLTPKGVMVAALIEHFTKLAAAIGHSDIPQPIMDAICDAVNDIDDIFAREYGIRLTSANNLPVTTLN